MGTSDLKIMFNGILPNISSIIIVDSTLALAGNIGIETTLSFLGFGLPANVPSLGTLIALARRPEIIQSKLFVWVPASLLILFMMLCINYIGQALRRASDARQRLG
ncbi:ABC transporter, permease domain protein [Peptoniphilus sp. BV3C26]|nr:ABC transporter, permease domain protein [Peptoniphilus sp. BV3C26]